MTLDDIINKESETYMKQAKKVMVVSDLHFPFEDKESINITKKVAQLYKPNYFVINGDLVDMYSLSFWDKNPDNFDVKHELNLAKSYLKDMRKLLGKDTTMVYLEGNHEARLQRYLWKNPELANLDVLKMENLLDLDELNIKWVGGEMDYWKKTSGSYNIGDTRIMHGDNRMNGASTSKYSGYSIKNTVQTTRKNTVIGHVHRGAVHYNTNEDGTLIGLENGCLCQEIPTANWQQGFSTFEVYRGKGMDFKFHHINKHKLVYNGKIIKG